MFIGSSIKFTSPDLRIVCLTNCAKIIKVACVENNDNDSNNNERIVHHLGVEDIESSSSSNQNQQQRRRQKDTRNIATSLRAFHALLQQIFLHLKTLGLPSSGMLTEEKPPYDIGRNYIGSYDLTQLQDKDDVTWNIVIHCMASNMKWLSKNASLYSSYSCSD